MIRCLEPFGDCALWNVWEVRSAFVDLMPCLEQITVVLAENLEVTQDHVRVQVETLVLAEIGIALLVHLRAAVHHETGQNLASRPHATGAAAVPRLHQTPPNLVFEVIRGALRFLTEHLDVRRSHHRVSEIVDHARGHHLHIIAFAGINEQIGFDHRHIAEEAVYVLRRDQANLPRLDQVVELRHAFTLTDFLCPADRSIGVDHGDILAHIALMEQMLDHVDGLQGRHDIANLSFGRLAIVHGCGPTKRQRLCLVRVNRLLWAF